eukprot:7203073-Prorocentrum_lima.AAC.1
MGDPTLASAEWEDYDQENPDSWDQHEWANNADDPGDQEEYQYLQAYYGYDNEQYFRRRRSC